MSTLSTVTIDQCKDAAAFLVDQKNNQISRLRKELTDDAATLAGMKELQSHRVNSILNTANDLRRALIERESMIEIQCLIARTEQQPS